MNDFDPISEGATLSESDQDFDPLKEGATLSSKSVFSSPPKMVNTIFGKLPYSSDEDFNKQFFSKENINQAINSLAIPSSGMMVEEVYPFAKNFLNKISYKGIGKVIQNSHDYLKNEASNIFDDVSNEVNNRNIPKFPTRNNVFNQIRSGNYLPDTRQSRLLINNAENGDYNALRDLQSDLGTLGRRAKSSELLSENNKGNEMFDLRDIINEDISDHLKNTGNQDLSDSLDKAIKKWSDLHEIYYSDPTIAKLVNEQTRYIPRNIPNILLRESKPMNLIRSAHPDTIKALKIRNALMWSGIGGLGILGDYKLHELYKLLF